MNILILTSGSVSAKLSQKLADRLQNDGHSVRHYATQTAFEMMKADSPVSISECSVSCYTNRWSPFISVDHEIRDWRDKPAKPILHIDLVRWADVCVVCPADFNIVGKMANGIADDVVSSTLAAWLGTDKKIYICEAMNSWMYQNPVHQKNIETLDKLYNVRFIEPTVKKLACGDIGIGALADIGTIANIVEGHTWSQPISQNDLLGEPMYKGRPYSYKQKGMFGKFVYDANSNEFIRGKCWEKFRDYIPRFYEPGAFGAIRKFDIHEGVDIYTHDGADVHAVEDGVVTAVYEFTGKNADCNWWNETWCINVESKSGVVTYGELAEPMINVGAKVYAGGIIGHVTPVLKPEKYRPDIRNHSVAMLHLELRSETCHLDGWKLGEQRDRKLLDPTPYLKSKDIISIV